MDEYQKRQKVFGSETEYGIICHSSRSGYVEFPSSHWGDITVRIAKHIPPDLRSFHNQFLGNGGRLYIDALNLEYATPEVVRARDLIAARAAGDRLAEQVVRAFAEGLSRYGSESWRMDSYTTNRHMNEATLGAHESYQADRNPYTEFWALVPALGPFLISRIFAGSGWLCKDNGGIRYELFQRSPFMKSECSVGTMSDQGGRGIINMRDEPHADKTKYCRVHIICGDTGNAHVACGLKAWTTRRVLDAIETGYAERELRRWKTLGNGELLRAFHVFSADPDLRVTARIAGKSYSLIDLQETYRDLVSGFCRDYERYDDEFNIFAPLWDDVILKMKQPHPHEALAPYLDCSAKYWLIHEYLSRRGIDIRMPDGYMCAKEIDIKYHLNAPHGIARILLERGELLRLVSEEAIEEAMRNPVSGRYATRAYARVRQMEFLAASFPASGYSERSVDWSRLVIVNGRGADVYRFENPEPRDSDPRLPVRPLA